MVIKVVKLGVNIISLVGDDNIEGNVNEVVICKFVVIESCDFIIFNFDNVFYEKGVVYVLYLNN